MLHPRLTSLDGTQKWLAEIGPYGSWGDLTYRTRWGEGACGMYEASFTMPLPAGFEDPLLRRGTMVDLMDGPRRVASSLVLTEPAVGSGLSEPWTITCTGLGREVEGENSWYCDDGSGNATTIASTAITVAIGNGLQWAGIDSTIPTGIFVAAATDQLNTIAALLNSQGDAFGGQRWGVKQDNYAGFLGTDPTTPTYHVTPGSAALGTADDDYATVVKVRYLDSTTATYLTRKSPASASAVEQRFGRKEYPFDATIFGPMAAADAQLFADGILAKSKGRLAWTNGLTLTSNDLLTAGGVPADLSMVAEDVGKGCMVRLHGIWSDLLEFNGQTYLDIVIGEAVLQDGAQTIQLSPLGMAPRDMAAVFEAQARGMGLAA